MFETTNLGTNCLHQPNEHLHCSQTCLDVVHSIARRCHLGHSRVEDEIRETIINRDFGFEIRPKSVKLNTRIEAPPHSDALLQMRSRSKVLLEKLIVV
jgi:hypothetical protein